MMFRSLSTSDAGPLSFRESCSLRTSVELALASVRLEVDTEIV